MTTELIPLSFHKMKQTRNYTEIVLQCKDKLFAIYAEAHVGKNLYTYLSDTERSRPLTHDLITSIFHGLDIHVKQVVIHDIQDTTYFARLFLEQNLGAISHIVEVDARPSDCIALALMHHVPIYCSKKIYELIIPVVEH